MQKQHDRPPSTIETEYVDKFRKFSEAVFDGADNFDNIELDFNRNPSVSSKNGTNKTTQKAAQVQFLKN